MDDSLLDKDGLARLLGLAPETVRWYSTQCPERLPPRVAWSRKLLFDRATAVRWIEERNGSKASPPIVVTAPVVPVPEVRAPRAASKPGRPRAKPF